MGTPQEHRRHQAIVRYLAGDPFETICRELHCAKSWLYTWKARYQAGQPVGARSQGASRAKRLS